MFDKTAYLVRERVAFAKFSDVYDIIELETGAQVAVAYERPGLAVHVGRFLVNKKLLPTKVHIAAKEDGAPVISIERGFTLLRSKVHVRGQGGESLGHFRSKLLSLGGGFHVHTPDGNKVAEVKGDWKGWNFKFLDASGREVGAITRKWGGLGKELFTSADNYVVQLAAGQSQAAIYLLMAAAIAIDTVYKE